MHLYYHFWWFLFCSGYKYVQYRFRILSPCIRLLKIMRVPIHFLVQYSSTLSVCFLNFLTFFPTKGAPALGSVTVFSKFRYIFWYTLEMSFGEVILDECIDAFSVHSLVHGPRQHLFISIYR